MALSADTQPHFTTIADFISSMDREIVKLFLEVLLVYDEQGIIGKEMFAIDGCKLPSNASKEWSGTRADFLKKVEKMEKALAQILEKHCQEDQLQTDSLAFPGKWKPLKNVLFCPIFVSGSNFNPRNI